MQKTLCCSPTTKLLWEPSANQALKWVWTKLTGAAPSIWRGKFWHAQLAFAFCSHGALMAELLDGRLLRRVSSKRHYQGLGVAAGDILRSNVLPGKVAKRPQLLHTAYSVDTSRWPTRMRCMRSTRAAVSTTTQSHNPVNTTTCRKSRKSSSFLEMDPADIPLLETYSTPALVSTLVLFSMQHLHG